MKVILNEDVVNLGEMGATVTVSDGYARNFLIPRKLAVTAESSSAKQIEHERRLIRAREEKRRKVFTDLAEKVEGIKEESTERLQRCGGTQNYTINISRLMLFVVSSIYCQGRWGMSQESME